MQLYSFEDQKSTSTTLKSEILKPHNPGHTDNTFSKWKIKLVRNIFVAEGITLQAIEEVLAARDMQEAERVTLASSIQN